MRLIRAVLPSTLLALALSVCTGCAHEQRGTLTLVGSYTQREDELAKLYAEQGRPIVLIGKSLYLPTVECTCPESRRGGGATEARRSGGGNESRQGGGNAERRRGGGDTEARDGGGGGEARGGGGGTENRNSGGGAEARASGGAAESRNLGHAGETRSLGGGGEDRHFGGATLPIVCVKQADCSGFRIEGIDTRNGNISYYDGRSLKRVSDGFVPLR